MSLKLIAHNMPQFIASFFIFGLWSIAITVLYFAQNSSHATLIAGADGYFGYLILLCIAYALYKGLMLWRNPKEVRLGF